MQGKATTWTAQSKWDWPSSIFNLHCTQGQKQTLQNTNDKTNYRNSSKANDTANHDTWGGKITSSRLKEVFYYCPNAHIHTNRTNRREWKTRQCHDTTNEVISSITIRCLANGHQNETNQIKSTWRQTNDKTNSTNSKKALVFVLFLCFFCSFFLRCHWLHAFCFFYTAFFLNWNNQVAINNWHDFRFFKHELLLRLSFSISNLCVIFYLGRKKISP